MKMSRSDVGRRGAGTNGTHSYRSVPCPVPCPVPDQANKAEKLVDLSRRVGRLSPDRGDPEAFHAEKSELAHELRRLAAVLAREPS